MQTMWKLENRAMELSSLLEVPMLLCSAVAILVSILLCSRASRTRRELRKIPGSMGWPLIGESISFASGFSSPIGIYSFVSERQQRYGKVFKSSFFGKLLVFVTGREASKTLFSGKNGMLDKNVSYAGKQLLGHESVFTTTGEDHKRIRRVITEPLSADALKKYLEFIDDLAISMLEGWPGRTINVFEEASLFSLKAISHMIMSLDPTGKEQQNLHADLELINSSFSALPIKIPGTSFHRGIKAHDRLYAMFDSIMSRRRNGVDIKDDFLQTLLRKHSKEEADNDDEDLSKLTDMQLKDNIISLLFAGYETTSTTLTWLLKYVEESPGVLQKLREEHWGIQETRNGGLKLTWSEVSNMPYTNKVISETLRKATIVPWLTRKATHNVNIDGYEIKKGWSVSLDLLSVHHDPNIFPDPTKFDPSRFDESIKPYSFLGFSAGPRTCPGMNLARLEMAVFIHHLICRFKWRCVEKDDTLAPTYMRRPKNEYPIVVEAL